MNVYYWKDKKNFGDALAPHIVKRFLHVDAEWSSPENADIVVIGSILDKLPHDFRGLIVGCGKLYEESVLDLPYAPVLALRGPLTANTTGTSIVLADPGLLADELVGYQNKIYNLGLVPHWTDMTLEIDPRFTKYNPKIIRVSDDPLEVVRQIGQCKKIVSSSLHGIIVADAFGIPRRIEIPPRILTHSHQEGGLFKWRDYSASIGMELKIGVTEQTNKDVIKQKQHELFDVFKIIRQYLQ